MEVILNKDDNNLFWSIESYNGNIISSEIKKLYEGVLPYIKNFLCSPHPDRKGNVCPFVPAAVKRDTIYFSYFFEDDSKVDFLQHSKDFIKKSIIFYIKKKEQSKYFGALIILFPHDYDILKLLEIHLINKQQCVENQLMIGALWDKNQAQSLHNPNFFPLRTPTPILVIRDLTIHDLIFLDPKYYNIKMRIQFLNTFIKKFGGENYRTVDNAFVKEALVLKSYYRRKENIRKLIWIARACFILLAIGNILW